ncbi:MAG TPA: helix-turn-helix domain-containing protein [Candidatus Diapherotrites archaeon]|uniref:Helix-turn-helix domain-containing protein n=1 Tax=Candidatus Iainarchaeum sp. TaxID=3101447 RepID=A0A7J4J2Z5_9ARCH|nr:helix-turn-helix domain-containing protein [Candidatus Diapherotrites archaeon]
MADQLATIIAGEIALSKDPGSSMKKWREIFGVSQTELAEVLKISSSTISDYEGGRRKSPGIGVVARLVDSLLDIDKNRGNKVKKQLEKNFAPRTDVFDIAEFSRAIDGRKFAELLGAECVANPGRLKDTMIYGYSIIDSLKVIIDVPVHEYIKMYGKTPERALIFMQVGSGRSPMIAVKVGRFSTEMRPALVVLHGIDKVDPIAQKIAESEKIPLLITTRTIEEIKKALKEFET